ncbi:Multidrug ABC transporter, ATP-binding protein [Candidatus Glomeribacter gigasporarum BEG34]|uniref:Multidrug ABC transporter, ATP-binding protein n=1 Tax=Candidatus Glomeribacter gigasporarum BEG34 TaxID=1070319 RepID=G2J9D6_9BURK|nr:ABC transporter ATP-binding protein [Candidatus Glomeribacter gigasporarum]CCD29383.1 Multidrug ABC transporter, ATP-binding protein [Candidatus Glomeribacter gigasporarum BEG34]
MWVNPAQTLWNVLQGKRGLLAGVLVLELAAHGAALAQPIVTGILIDRLQHGGSGSLSLPILLLASASLIGLVFTGVCTYSLGHTSQWLVRNLRFGLISRILGAKVSAIEPRSIGEFLSRAGSDTTLLQSTIGEIAVSAVAAPVVMLAAVVLMSTIDGYMTVLVVALLALTTWGEKLVLSRVSEAAGGAQKQVAAMTSALHRILIAFRTIKASNTRAYEEGEICRRAYSAYRSGVQMEKAKTIVQIIAFASLDLPFLVVLTVGTLRAAASTLGLGDLVAFLLYVGYLREPVENLACGASALSEGLAAMKRIIEIEDLPLEPNTVSSRSIGMAGNAGCGQIQFNQVSFAYANRPVLQDVSFSAGLGLTVLVGPSGAGKTTVLSLIERFAEADTGKVMLDGRDVCEFDLDVLRSRLAYVQQEAPLLGETVREAALYGVPNRKQVDLHVALRAVALDKWVASLPDGLDTTVGERGTAISGGQRQRLAVARALLRDADVLLLDEATSQLDVVSERTLLASLVREARNRIVIAVTHRLSAVMEADQVVFLEEGRVRAVGRPDELVDVLPSWEPLHKAT